MVVHNPGVGSTVELPELNLPADSMFHSDSAGVAEAIADVAAGQVLTSQGATTVPAWAKPIFVKSFNLPDPTASDDFGIIKIPKAITISKIILAVNGTTPSVTAKMVHDTDLSAAGTDIFAALAITSETTGQEPTLTDATIPTDSWIRIVTSALSGTVKYILVTFVYTED